MNSYRCLWLCPRTTDFIRLPFLLICKFRLTVKNLAPAIYHHSLTVQPQGTCGVSELLTHTSMRNKFITRAQYLCALPFTFSIIVSSQNLIFQSYLGQPNFSCSSVRCILVSFRWIYHVGRKVSWGSRLLTGLWDDLSVGQLSPLCVSVL